MRASPLVMVELWPKSLARKFVLGLAVFGACVLQLVLLHTLSGRMDEWHDRTIAAGPPGSRAGTRLAAGGGIDVGSWVSDGAGVGAGDGAAAAGGASGGRDHAVSDTSEGDEHPHAARGQFLCPRLKVLTVTLRLCPGPEAQH